MFDDLSFANIALMHVSSDDVLRVVRAMGRSGYVSPSDRDTVAVYDKECDEGNPAVLEQLAARLTESLACRGLAFLDWRERFYLCALFEQGTCRGRYAWTLDGSGPDVGPVLPCDDFAEEIVTSVLGPGHSDTVTEIRECLGRTEALAEEARRKGCTDPYRASLAASMTHYVVVWTLGMTHCVVNRGYHVIECVRQGIDTALDFDDLFEI
jgi:hypothetical protein